MLRSDKLKQEIETLKISVSEQESLLEKKRSETQQRLKLFEEKLQKHAEKQTEQIRIARSSKIAVATQALLNSNQELENEIASCTDRSYVPWNSPAWNEFETKPSCFAYNLTRFGSFVVKTSRHSLEFPGVISILGGQHLLLRATGNGRQKARAMLRNIVLRLMGSVPPGKLRFTFIDPVELGSTAAGLVGSLPDFLTGGLAWHEEQDIYTQLSLIETRIAAIKTKYLGIDFNSIEEFNASAGTIQEPYWVVVVSDYPMRFRDTASEKLISIAKNGPAAGVYLALMVDEGQGKRVAPLLLEVAQLAHQFEFPDSDEAFYDHPEFRNLPLKLDTQPTPRLIAKLVEHVTACATAAQTVRVDWEAPSPESWWAGDSRHGLEVPIGIYGARRIQTFKIDEKLLSSALVVGKPGSGKSRLLHAIIGGLITRYSPEEVSLFLLDCKQVEFRDYATHKLPHARVIAIESEREFGLSVLRNLNSELDTRKQAFTLLGETCLSNFRNKATTPMPRIVLIIDEFQELLNADDVMAREAASILDRLVRQGRAFGINLILASQSLGGMSTLSASTKNQIPIRIVLQCSESDSVSVLSHDNDEARLLERPGEAIYNSANGRREGNNRFQVGWLPDEKLESILSEIRDRSIESTRNPLIFCGNALANICENGILNSSAKPRLGLSTAGPISAWLGEPIEMKEPTSAVFKRQSRSNLLLIGQNEYEEACLAMLLASIVSIALQHDPENAEFVVIDLSDQSLGHAEILNLYRTVFPHRFDVIQKPRILDKLKDLCALIESRATQETNKGSASVFLVFMGLHRDRDLRRVSSTVRQTSATRPLIGGDFLSKICKEGPSLGIHSLVWSDTFSNFEKVYEARHDIDEFSLRVGLQMSESDSRSFLDSEAASRLGGQRAVFYNDEKHMKLEKFRPYATPPSDWIKTFSNRFTT